MNSGQWVKITEAANIPLREGRAVSLAGANVAIFNLGYDFVAIENECPHQGGPLCDGIVSGTVVVCPLHGWKFDLNSGDATKSSIPACVATFPTRVENGIVMLDVTNVRPAVKAA